MLSYRHAFHAGNFADVLKHTALTVILEHLAAKDKPYCCIDTHAGPGWCDLTHAYAQKNREFDTGIGRLWDRTDLPAAVARYMELVKGFNGGGDLRRYPGSPWFQMQFLRPHDRLFLFELHSTDFEALTHVVHGRPGVKAVCDDGFRGCVGLVPPLERRGAVLLDPPYEIKTDYMRAGETLQRLYRRFASGIYALWYPLIEGRGGARLARAVVDGGIPDAHLFELCIRPRRGGDRGMRGCGMIVVNPPWTLPGRMREALPFLADALGDGGAYRALALTPERTAVR